MVMLHLIHFWSEKMSIQHREYILTRLSLEFAF